MLTNYRNSYRDMRSRNAYMANQRAGNHAAALAHNQNMKMQRDLLKSQPGFMGSGGTLSHEIDNQLAMYTPAEQMADNYYTEASFNAFDSAANENLNAWDRKMDLADNEQGRKNLQTEYDRATQMEKIRAAERMNNRNNQGLESLMDGTNTASSVELPVNMQVPDYDLYSNNGNRMGGSYFGRALLG